MAKSGELFKPPDFLPNLAPQEGAENRGKRLDHQPDQTVDLVGTNF